VAVRRIISNVASTDRRGPDPARIRRTIEQAVEHEVPVNPDQRGDVLATAAFETDNSEHLAVEIGALWSRAQETFLTIGTRIVKARGIIEERIRGNNSHLTPAERRAQTNAEWQLFLAKLPFSFQIASQLECVARALESGRLDPAELPNSYSVAYQLTTMTDAELEVARKEGIVGARAKRDDIIEFKRRLRKARVDRENELVQRRKKIVAYVERLRRELLEIDRELGEGGKGGPVIEGVVE
jgi:hypothetical protein